MSIAKMQTFLKIESRCFNADETFLKFKGDSNSNDKM